jgi:hypothetical protein
MMIIKKVKYAAKIFFTAQKYRKSFKDYKTMKVC